MVKAKKNIDCCKADCSKTIKTNVNTNEIDKLPQLIF